MPLTRRACCVTPTMGWDMGGEVLRTLGTPVNLSVRGWQVTVTLATVVVISQPVNVRMGLPDLTV